MRVARLFNRQRARRLDRRQWRRLTRCLLVDLLGRRDYELAVHLVGAVEMARLNQEFLGHEGSTDVITFNYEETPAGRMARLEPRPAKMPGRARLLPSRACSKAEARPKLHGEIFISVDDALAWARRFRVRWPREVARYLVHGVLHLEGCDDTDPVSRRAMKRRENKLLKELSRRLDLRKLAA